jgi:3-(3-hydroxy-phenyl)propionate hydroxylase
VLTLAREHAFARALVNSGRLSVPSLYLQSSLNTPDDEAAQSPAGAAFQGWMKPGAPMDDAPVQALTLARPLAGSDAAAGDWLLGHVGRRFALMVYVTLGEAVAQLPRLQALAGATAACGPAAAGQALDVFVILPQQGAGGGVGDGAGCAAADAAASIHTLARAGISVLHDLKGLLARRYDLSAGDGYLLRPDQHVAARWRVLDPARVLAAWRRALGWR